MAKNTTIYRPLQKPRTSVASVPYGSLVVRAYLGFGTLPCCVKGSCFFWQCSRAGVQTPVNWGHGHCTTPLIASRTEPGIRSRERKRSSGTFGVLFYQQSSRHLYYRQRSDSGFSTAFFLTLVQAKKPGACIKATMFKELLLYAQSTGNPKNSLSIRAACFLSLCLLLILMVSSFKWRAAASRLLVETRCPIERTLCWAFQSFMPQLPVRSIVAMAMPTCLVCPPLKCWGLFWTHLESVCAKQLLSALGAILLRGPLSALFRTHPCGERRALERHQEDVAVATRTSVITFVHPAAVCSGRIF